MNWCERRCLALRAGAAQSVYEQEYSSQPPVPLRSDFPLHYPRFVLQAKRQNKLNHLLHSSSPPAFHFKFVLNFNTDTKVIELPGQILCTAAPDHDSLGSVVKHPPNLASLYFSPHRVTAPKNSHPKRSSQSPQSINFWKQMTLY